MQKILKFIRVRKKTSILIFIIIAIVLYNTAKPAPLPTWTTDTVQRGTVRNIISVSGAVDAIGSAELAFPTTGIVEHIAVTEGAVVEKDSLLITLVHDDVKAEYQDAYAELVIAEAHFAELMIGLRPEEYNVSKTTYEIAKEALTRITREENSNVDTAYRTLLSTDLVAVPNNPDNEDVPPTIVGTYTCDEGMYTLDVFHSSTPSGHSYRLGGLESGTYSAHTETHVPFGTCGLAIRFDADENYRNDAWSISIPNTQSAEYITNEHAYKLATAKRQNAIEEAEQNLLLAEQNRSLDTSAPRTEVRTREEARVLQAKARLQVLEARMREHILRAPFDGTVTTIDTIAGETVTGDPVVTLVSNNAYELTALIPEIDVTKVKIGQMADVVFDALQDQTLSATITFISPLAKEVDGVSYFEAKLLLQGDHDWLKSGLNADIDIIVETHENVVRIPKRYLTEKEGVSTVETLKDDVPSSVPVTVSFRGNDGYVEIAGVEEGTTIIAP